MGRSFCRWDRVGDGQRPSRRGATGENGCGVTKLSKLCFRPAVPRNVALVPRLCPDPRAVAARGWCGLADRDQAGAGCSSVSFGRQPSEQHDPGEGDRQCEARDEQEQAKSPAGDAKIGEHDDVEEQPERSEDGGDCQTDFKVVTRGPARVVFVRAVLPLHEPDRRSAESQPVPSMITLSMTTDIPNRRADRRLGILPKRMLKP